MKRLVASLLSLFLAGGIAQAQSADEFCATAPTDLLSALDGAWTLTHGPGVSMTGMGTHAFPAPEPTTLQFQYLPNYGFGELSGDGQSMLMFPAGGQATAAYIDGVISQSSLQNVQPNSAGCDWYALPSLVGTNSYVLEGNGNTSIDLEDLRGMMFDGDLTIWFCANTPTYDFFEDIDNEDSFAAAGVDDEECRARSPQSGQGDMSMTLFLKFDSPSSASGVASFSGDMRAGRQRIRFAAETPVWMTR